MGKLLTELCSIRNDIISKWSSKNGSRRHRLPDSTACILGPSSKLAAIASLKVSTASFFAEGKLFTWKSSKEWLWCHPDSITNFGEGLPRKVRSILKDGRASAKRQVRHKPFFGGISWRLPWILKKKILPLHM